MSALNHGAAKIAGIAMARSDPGSVLVSGAVRQTIRGPIAERLVSRGTIQLDKMAETIGGILPRYRCVGHGRGAIQEQRTTSRRAALRQPFG